MPGPLHISGIWCSLWKCLNFKYLFSIQFQLQIKFQEYGISFLIPLPARDLPSLSCRFLRLLTDCCSLDRTQCLWSNLNQALENSSPRCNMSESYELLKTVQKIAWSFRHPGSQGWCAWTRYDVKCGEFLLNLLTVPGWLLESVLARELMRGLVDQGVEGIVIFWGMTLIAHAFLALSGTT